MCGILVCRLPFLFYKLKIKKKYLVVLGLVAARGTSVLHCGMWES